MFFGIQSNSVTEPVSIPSVPQSVRSRGKEKQKCSKCLFFCFVFFFWTPFSTRRLQKRKEKRSSSNFHLEWIDLKEMLYSCQDIDGFMTHIKAFSSTLYRCFVFDSWVVSIYWAWYISKQIYSIKEANIYNSSIHKVENIESTVDFIIYFKFEEEKILIEKGSQKYISICVYH